MANNLLCAERCTACRKDSPQLTDAELADLLPEIPEWTLTEVEGVPRLERSFRFPDFARALAFTNAVGAAAEAEDHHPQLTTAWGRVTVTWWTHAIKGLHRNDVIMAARTDAIAAEASGAAA